MSFKPAPVIDATERFLQQLARIIPAQRIGRSDSYAAAFESDGLSAFAEKPIAVVIVRDEREVQQTIRICNEHSIPFVARGSGTSLSGGAMPVAGGIVIAMNQMNRILEVDGRDRIARVQPGVVTAAVSIAAAPLGLHYAPDPSSGAVCTIGGNVAFNSGGAHCLKYGMTSNHVIGMRVVTGDGNLKIFGGRTIESNGPDLTALFCGSEGLFGIATEITLRLLPLSETVHTVLVGYDSPRSAGLAVSAIIASGLLPAAIEIMDATAIEAAEAAVGCGYPAGAGSVLIVELEGPRESVDQQRRRLAETLGRTDPGEIVVARDADHRAAIWRGRKSAFSAAGKLSPDFLVQDGVVPRAKLGDALEAIGRLAAAANIRVANVFHAGDGNLHPLIMYDGTIDGEFEAAEKLAGEILLLCIEMGGSITGEHGVGIEKREFLTRMFDPDSIDLMKRLRNVFDPHLLANPGKVFPDGTAPALLTPGLHPLEVAGVIQRD